MMHLPASATALAVVERSDDMSLFIDGRWEERPERIPVTDPATGEVVGEVSRGSAKDAERAVEAAARAFAAWRAVPADQRAQPLHRVAAMLREQREELARGLTREQGKPLADARGEIQSAADVFDWYAEEGRRVHGEVLPAPAADRRFWVWREPVGVAAVITPWNYPMQTVARKVATALAAGCTAVVKPSGLTPLSAVALMRILEAAEVPAGCVNLVTGPADEIGGVLTSHPQVRKISFTGSTEVGKLLMAQASGTVKSLSLELGGHAPLLVFDDADLDRAVQGAVTARFRSMGQICHSANRIFVQRGIWPRFRERYAQAVASLKVAPGLESGAQIGPLINEAAVARCERHVQDAVARGAKLLVGGTRPREGALARGTFFLPAVLDECSPEMLVTREETFGPVAPILPFDDEAQALAGANATPYGLAAYLFTRDLGRAVRVAEGLEAGVIGLNDARAAGTPTPFGGVKESGFGREGGHWGIDEFLVTKSVAVTL